MGSDQQHPKQYKGCCCYQWEVDKRDTDNSFPCRLLREVRTDGYTFYSIIHSMALPGRYRAADKRWAMASPMPELAPVITTSDFFIDISFLIGFLSTPGIHNGKKVVSLRPINRIIQALQNPVAGEVVSVRSGGRSVASRFGLSGKCWCRKRVAAVAYRLVGPG